MKFQLAINLERMDDSLDMREVARHTLEMVQMAEDGGFHIVWSAEHHALEAERGRRAHVGQVGGDVAAVVFKEQAIPFLQFVVVQVEAGVLGKVGCAKQLAVWRVGPAVQWADDVAARAAFLLGLQIATTVQHHGLAVSADIGDELHPALGVAHQSAAFGLVGQGVIVARVGHRQLVAHIAGALPEERVQFALKQRLIEISGNW